MNRVSTGPVVLMTFVLALSGCNGSSTTNAPATPTPSPQVQNVSGDYLAGSTWQDSQSGTASSVKATLAQTGSAVGGVITGTFGGSVLNGSVAVVVTTASTFAGTMVIDYPPAGTGPSCTFSTSGTYSNNGSNSASLTGTYTAMTGCTGDSGTFTLSQNCIDTVTAISSARRRMVFPPHC